MDNRPIGVFDSGVGGLTVVNALVKYLPREIINYVGDTARVPYGNKSSECVSNYALDCTQFLLSKNVKSIIIACNTASAVAYKKIKNISPVPVFDVITPCVEEIIRINKKKIAILGTQKTIESNIYYNSIKKHINNITIYNIACPLFVPIVEEGLENTNISQSIIEYYLHDMRIKNIEQLILGCTNYPILLDDLNKFFNNKINILHSGPLVSKKIKSLLPSNNQNKPSVEYYVTDLPEYFQKSGSKFLNKKIEDVRKITLSRNNK